TATAALAAIQKSAQGQAEAYAGTMAGSLAVAGTEVEGIQEKLGKTLNDMAATILPPLIKGLGAVSAWFGQVVTAVQPLVAQVQPLAEQWLGAMADAFNQIVAALQPLMPVIEDLVKKDLEALATVVQAAAKWVTTTLVPA